LFLIDYTMLREERHRLIRKHIEEFEQATVSELSAMFDVSEATIRRDLEELDGRGWVRRAHGGAVRVERADQEPPLLDRLTEQAHEKQRIGRAAAGLIEDGDIVFLSSGTTVLEVAYHLRGKRNLTVMTNSLSVVNELATNATDATIIVLGGSLRPSEMSLIGHITDQNLRELRANKLIMGMRSSSSPTIPSSAASRRYSLHLSLPRTSLSPTAAFRPTLLPGWRRSASM
jgi:DeoR family transcriptional regulator of aga operon